ncbi:hypothetical protein KV697_10870 [Sphingomonas sanguinis]|uniref:hypothetical protein n=1 Tax=Sphingomonas sanguinis TaxID=33051 RepID=UPI001C57B76D|nr:hypothetical protein [Sphingomonas sanguinis]QXT34337.1 hypothetical protein KV697_10870 [Sphingomonas sanguinis]
MSDEQQAPKVSAVAVKAFTDAGTERAFVPNKPFELTQGEFDNYHAAGLVEIAPADATDGDASTAKTARQAR